MGRADVPIRVVGRVVQIDIERADITGTIVAIAAVNRGTVEQHSIRLS